MAKKKSKKQLTTQKKENSFWIDKELVKQSTGIEEDDKISTILDCLKEELYYWPVIVVSIDIRKSSIALINVEDFQAYQDSINDFICYVAATWRLSNEKFTDIKKHNVRFFDKFTGDGAIFFLALPDLRAVYESNDEKYEKEWMKHLKESVQYCEKIIIKFLKTTLPGIRKACGTQPCNFGLSIGIDVGECLVTDMQPSEDYNYYKEDYKGDIELEHKKYPIDNIGGNITVIGRPVIGASRMVEIADAYEILINSHPGATLKADEDNNFQLIRKYKEIKECDCIEVYSFVSDKIKKAKKGAGINSNSICEDSK